MRFWVGVTDKSWFLQRRAAQPYEANFWQTSPKPAAARVEELLAKVDK